MGPQQAVRRGPGYYQSSREAQGRRKATRYKISSGKAARLVWQAERVMDHAGSRKARDRVPITAAEEETRCNPISRETGEESQVGRA